jgi:hypothetical protein
MEVTDVLNSIWIGLSIGAGTMIVSSLILIPVSYVMNKFIYHGAVMRFVMGLLAGLGSLLIIPPIIFLIFSSRFKKAHYFGLIPLRAATAEPEEASWVNFMFVIFRAFAHPFQWVADDAGYRDSIGAILAPEGDTTVVSEELFEAARIAGGIRNRNDWTAAMGDIRRDYGPALNLLANP